MSLRSNGSYLGPRPTGPSSTVASGIWDLRTAERQIRSGAWTPEVPRKIGGLELWLDASSAETLYDATSGGSLVAADGGVARWEDKSGNGRHATQGTSGRRPTRKSAAQNGLDVLRFDGNATPADADRLQIANSASEFNFLHLSAGSVFVVVKNGTTENYNDIRTWVDSCGLAASQGFYFGPDDRSSLPVNNSAIAISGNMAGSARVGAPDGFVAMQTAKVYTCVVDNTAATASRMFIYGNGTDAGVANTASGATTGDATYSLMIGSAADDGGAFSFQGDFLELLIYSSALSNADRESVEGYLMAKWGIS